MLALLAFQGWFTGVAGLEVSSGEDYGYGYGDDSYGYGGTHFFWHGFNPSDVNFEGGNQTLQISSGGEFIN